MTESFYGAPACRDARKMLIGDSAVGPAVINALKPTENLTSWNMERCVDISVSLYYFKDRIYT